MSLSISHISTLPFTASSGLEGYDTFPFQASFDCDDNYVTTAWKMEDIFTIIILCQPASVDTNKKITS